jgi:hypothetical protein
MPIAKLVVLVAVISYAPIASADRPTYSRRSEVPVSKLSTRAQPSQPRRTHSEGWRPGLRIDDILVIPGSKIPDAQAAILIDLIQQTPDREADEKAEYYFRLAELYAKQHRYWRLKAMELAITEEAERTKARP